MWVKLTNESTLVNIDHAQKIYITRTLSDWVLRTDICVLAQGSKERIQRCFQMITLAIKDNKDYVELG